MIAPILVQQQVPTTNGVHVKIDAFDESAGPANKSPGRYDRASYEYLPPAHDGFCGVITEDGASRYFLPLPGK